MKNSCIRIIIPWYGGPLSTRFTWWRRRQGCVHWRSGEEDDALATAATNQVLDEMIRSTNWFPGCLYGLYSYFFNAYLPWFSAQKSMSSSCMPRILQCEWKTKWALYYFPSVLPTVPNFFCQFQRIKFDWSEKRLLCSKLNWYPTTFTPDFTIF